MMGWRFPGFEVGRVLPEMGLAFGFSFRVSPP
jgi:hypothetical protein